MNLPNAVRVRYDNLRSLDWSLVGVNYAAIGTPFSHPLRLLKLSNGTDANMLISLNGLDDVDVLYANSYCLYDFSSNKATQGGYLELAAGERIYIKAEDNLPGAGVIYVTCLYASQV